MEPRRSQREEHKHRDFSPQSRPSPSPSHESSNPPPGIRACPTSIQPKRKKTRSQIIRDYRNKILADPEKGARYLDACREKSKKFRDNATEEQKKKMREGARLRMQRYREKKKIMASTNSKPRTRKEDKEIKPAKARAAEAKRKGRENRTPQKRAWDNLKRRQKRAAKKVGKQKAAETQTPAPPSSAVQRNPSTSLSETADTPAAKRSGPCRARKADLVHVRRMEPGDCAANWTVNSCVIVEYPEGWLPGVIVAVQPQLRIKFLRQHRHMRDVFVFPDVGDIQTVVPDMIISTSTDLLPVS